MAEGNTGATVRRNIRNTSEPMELRELNRQMEWIWRKLLGGLDERAFSNPGMTQVTKRVENVITENIRADTIDTNMLTAALAKLMVAVIGVCDADYLHAVDANIESLIVRRGLGESFTFDNLRIIYAQIVSATIGDLVVKASDGRYYKLDVDKDGNVTTTDVTVTADEINAGMTNAGQVILGTDILAEELSTRNLAATFALIAKLDAERINVDQLVARQAFITALYASEAFIDSLKAVKIYGDRSLDVVVRDSANDIQDVDVEFYLSLSPTLLTGGEWTTDAPGTVPEGQYLWQRTKTVTAGGKTTYRGLQCLTSLTSEPGPPGVGIEDVEEHYGVSNDSATPPTSWTSDEPPFDELSADMRYMWNYETLHYTDGSQTDTQKRIICVYSEDGRGVKDTVNHYLATSLSSGVTWDTDGWTTTVQTITPSERYLWNYEETIYTDDSSARTYPCVIGVYGEKGEQGLRGLQGPDGEQGIQGPPGKDGAKGDKGDSVYFHIKYSPVPNPTANQMSEEPNVYIGTYVDSSPVDSGDPNAYKWARFQGLQGESGKDGIPGENGADGLTYYLHIKYSDDGGVNFTSSEGEDVGDYIGQCVNTSQADPSTPSSYKWSKIKGEAGNDGRGIEATEEQYYLSTSKEEPTGGSWSAEEPTWRPGTYIWTRVYITWDDGSHSTTEPVLANAINSANETADSANTSANSAMNQAGAARERADLNYENLQRWFNFNLESGLGIYLRDEDGNPASIWNTLIDEKGFYIKRRDLTQPVFAAERDVCNALNLEVGTNSNIVCKGTSTGGAVWTTK